MKPTTFPIEKSRCAPSAMWCMRGRRRGRLRRSCDSITRTRSAWPRQLQRWRAMHSGTRSQGRWILSVILDPPQRLEVIVTDAGPGISNLDEILAGRYKSDTGMGMGIIGTRRLMDEFDIATSPAAPTFAWRSIFPFVAARQAPRAIEEIQRKMKLRIGARSLCRNRATESGIAQDARRVTQAA